MRRPFRDSDADVERRTGNSVPAIFAARGEPAYRAEERAALCAVLTSSVPSVIAVAGGAVIDPETRRRLRHAGVVVWLDVAPDVLAARVGAGMGRPLLEGGSGRQLHAPRRASAVCVPGALRRRRAGRRAASRGARRGRRACSPGATRRADRRAVVAVSDRTPGAAWSQSDPSGPEPIQRQGRASRAWLRRVRGSRREGSGLKSAASRCPPRRPS